MNRLATALLAAALGVLGAVALADAVRGFGEGEPPPPRPAATAPVESAQRAETIAALREAEVEGVLTYSDADCRLHALSLPHLEPAPAPRIRSCHPHVPSDGIGVADGNVVWAGLGAGFVQVVLDRDDLQRALAPGLDEEDFRALQAASLGGGRVVVLVAAGAAGERVLAAFDGERLAWTLPRWQVGPADVVRPSPRGRYLALLDRETPGVRVFTRGGRALVLPALAGPHAVAWSPDERWTAIALEKSVLIFPSRRPLGTAIRVPVRVRDLDWGA